MGKETGYGRNGERIRTLTREALRRGLNVRTGATGVSMIPYIWPGSMVTIRPLAESEEPSEGAIVVIDRGPGDNFTMHRLTGRSGDAFITRGDSNPGSDQPVDRRDVIGVLTHTEGRIIKRRRRISPDGGAYWRIMKAMSPFSYAVNGIIAKIALRTWQTVVHLFFWKSK
ncbi:MAG: hypothetical protein ACI35Q_00605 [Marinilabiliaceae bacterium]